MVISIDQKSIRSRLKRVDPEIKDAFWSFDLAELVGLSASKRQLPDTIAADIGRIAGLVLLGFIPVKEAPAQLAESSSLGIDVAAAVFADLMIFFNPLMPKINEAQKTASIQEEAPATADVLKPLPLNESGPLYEKKPVAPPAPAPVTPPAPAVTPKPVISAYAMPTAAPAMPLRTPGSPVIARPPKAPVTGTPATAKALEPFIMRQETSAAPIQVDSQVAKISVQGAGFTSGDQMREIKGAPLPPPPKPARLEIGIAPKPITASSPNNEDPNIAIKEDTPYPFVRKSFVMPEAPKMPPPPRPVAAISASPFASTASASYIPPAPVPLGASPIAPITITEDAPKPIPPAAVNPVPLPPVPPAILK